MRENEKRITQQYEKYKKEWNEGFVAGENDFEKGMPLTIEDAKCKYKPFDWDYLAYQDGYVEGYLHAQENDYKTKP